MATRKSTRFSTSSSAQTAPLVSSRGTSASRAPKRKAELEAPVIDQDGFAVPLTPKRRQTTTDAPPLTPVLARAMAVPYSSGDIDDMTPQPRRNRLARPQFTNAPLISPQTSRVVETTTILPGTLPRVLHDLDTSDTEHVLEKALKHLLAVEPRLRPVIEKHHCHVFSPEGLSEAIDPFRSLASGIISQQVSGAAAKAIKARFVGLFYPTATPDDEVRFPTPMQVMQKTIPEMRTAGLSQRKAEYIQGMAEKFVAGDLSTEMLLNAEYEEVLEKLLAVRGLGKWSVEMFATFGLKRLNVFSTGDLGVQRGMAALIGKDVARLKNKGGGKWKYMSEGDMLEMAAKFAPYRSVFMWYMWRVEETDVSALEAT